MTELLDDLMLMLVNYGHWALAFITLLGGIGIPVPSSMILLATGAFIQQGIMSGEMAVILALTGVVMGDSISYMLGRGLRNTVIKRYESMPSWQRATDVFRHWGVWGIFLSRFLITPVALPINLLAGSTRFRFQVFAAAMFSGELIWVIIFIGSGYLFTDRWEEISGMASNLSAMLVSMLVVIISASLLVHLRRKRNV